MTANRIGRERIAVVMGGESGEREVSLRSGKAIAEGLPRGRFEVRPVVIAADGDWLVGKRCLALDERLEPSRFSFERLSSAAAVERLASEGTDCAFLALHGPRGEDGTVQGLLELHRLPYTGSGVAASAVCMDKTLSRSVLRAAGVPVPEGFEETADRWRSRREATLAWVAEVLGYPVFVKPVGSGSSLGVRRVEGPDALGAAVADALGHGPRFLVEREVRGVEATCGVLGNALDETLLALPPVEIRPSRDGFFTPHEKYDADGAIELCPPRTLSTEAVARVKEVALASHRALRCDGMSRTDLIVAEGNLPVVLEVNTIPGFTERSLLPKAAAAAGISFGELCERLVEAALRRFASERAPAPA